LKINLRRGLFRLWIIFACLFVISVGIASSDGIRDEFKRKASTKNQRGFTLMVPVDCSKARGELPSDYSKEKDGLCWYEMPKLRTLYTEYKDLNDAQLSDRLYAKAGIPLTPSRPWTKVMEATEIALGVPAAVLILGWALVWAFSGFRQAQL
jgi:hypothetical protein